MIEAPTNCPSCDSDLVWVKDQLYCKNTSCPAKSFKQIEHFSKTLKIKGLGPSTIEKLGLSSIDDIYEITEEFAAMQLKSEKLAGKLIEEIERSKSEPLNTVLPAFGIPLVGKTASDKLSNVVSCIEDIDAQACKSAGLGPKATENLLNWLEHNEIYHLPFSFEFSNKQQGPRTSEVVCISGKLKSFPTKAAATEALESLGFTVKSSLTKDVTILVNESGVETAKTKKAVDDGVTIVSNLKEYLENF